MIRLKWVFVVNTYSAQHTSMYDTLWRSRCDIFYSPSLCARASKHAKLATKNATFGTDRFNTFSSVCVVGAAALFVRKSYYRDAHSTRSFTIENRISESTVSPSLRFGLKPRSLPFKSLVMCSFLRFIFRNILTFTAVCTIHVCCCANVFSCKLFNWFGRLLPGFSFNTTFPVISLFLFLDVCLVGGFNMSCL